MSIQIMTPLFEADPNTYTAAQKSVLITLGNHADENGDRVYPSVERIMHYTSLGERVVRRILGEFRKSGILTVLQKATRYFPTQYHLNLMAVKIVPFRPASRAPLPVQACTKAQLRPAPDAPYPSVRDTSHLINNPTTPPASPHLTEPLALAPPPVAAPPSQAGVPPGASGCPTSPDLGPGPGKDPRKGGLARPAKAGASWLKDYDDAWYAKYKAHIPYSMWAKSFKELEADHGRPKVLSAWHKYVAQSEGRFNPTAFKFRSTFADWIEAEPVHRPPAVPHEWGNRPSTARATA